MILVQDAQASRSLSNQHLPIGKESNRPWLRKPRLHYGFQSERLFLALDNSFRRGLVEPRMILLISCLLLPDVDHQAANLSIADCLPHGGHPGFHVSVVNAPGDVLVSAAKMPLAVD